jgi:ABC-type branched-subunit amino acid transport system substrate-binding protein
LNKPGTGQPVGAYVRVVAADDRQAQMAARFLRERGHQRVIVLDDGDRYSLNSASYFAAAARAQGRPLWAASRGGEPPRSFAACGRRIPTSSG